MPPRTFKTALAQTATALALACSLVAGQAQADDWSGSYAGVQLGFGQTLGDDPDTGSALGFQAGRDWQVGDWVFGIGADVQFANGTTTGYDFDTLGRAKLRAGYDLGDTMLFVSTGASHASHASMGDDWGYFAGLGVEHRLDDNWSVTGEIARHRFDDFNGFGERDFGTATVGLNYRF